MTSPTVTFETRGAIAIVTIDRPQARNAVGHVTRRELAEAFRRFDADPALSVAVLTGAAGVFCAGFDLKDTAAGRREHRQPTGDGPMGPTRMQLSKPVIAAIEGWAVAGGLELALWCDLRVAASNAILGVFCRRFGVPLLDLGTVRLPRLIGHSRAMDLILTGRGVGAEEALRMGLVNRVVSKGMARSEAEKLAHELSRLPQTCMRHDRLSAYQQWDLDYAEAMANEYQHGVAVLASGETQIGAARFASGHGRGGSFSDI